MSYSVWPHRRQPTRLPHPWDSPGKNTGVGCHFLLQCMKVKSEVSQLRPTLSNPMDCSLPGSSVHEIFQARVLIINNGELQSLENSSSLPVDKNIPLLLQIQLDWLFWVCAPLTVASILTLGGKVVPTTTNEEGKQRSPSLNNIYLNFHLPA